MSHWHFQSPLGDCISDTRLPFTCARQSRVEDSLQARFTRVPDRYQALVQISWAYCCCTTTFDCMVRGRVSRVWVRPHNGLLRKAVPSAEVALNLQEQSHAGRRSERGGVRLRLRHHLLASICSGLAL